MKRLTMLLLVCIMANCIQAQVPYGNNPAAGKYFNTGDANIYYEVYGSGRPVLLLHGGVYGSIGENKKLIPGLSKKFMVIAVATRGHGKSELGHQPLSYKLFSEDAYKVLRYLTTDSAIVIGIADGAQQGYYLAADHPDAVKKLIAIGSNFGAAYLTGGDKKYINEFGAAYLEKNEPAMVADRKKLAPEPARFDEFIDEMAKVWRDSIYVCKETIAAIQCPTLIATGENDGCPLEKYVEAYRLLKKGHLAIIPYSDSLLLMRTPGVISKIILPFVDGAKLD